MDIPLWIILIPLGVVIALTLLFLFFNLFHLSRYGIVGRGALALMMTYFISYSILFFLGAMTLTTINWKQTVTIKDIIPFGPSSTTPFGL